MFENLSDINIFLIGLSVGAVVFGCLVFFVMNWFLKQAVEGWKQAVKDLGELKGIKVNI